MRKDEEKRSKWWRISTLTATSIIILVIVFFITKPLIKNPLVGTWKSVKADYTITFDKNEQIILKKGNDTLKLRYTLDKKEKTMAVHIDQAEKESLIKVSEGKLSEEDVDTSVSVLYFNFAYSIDDDTLTLTEREYGEQLVYTRE